MATVLNYSHIFYCVLSMGAFKKYTKRDKRKKQDAFTIFLLYTFIIVADSAADSDGGCVCRWGKIGRAC